MTNIRLYVFLQRSNHQTTAPSRIYWSTGAMSGHSYRCFHLHRPCWCL